MDSEIIQQIYAILFDPKDVVSLNQSENSNHKSSDKQRIADTTTEYPAGGEVSTPKPATFNKKVHEPKHSRTWCEIDEAFLTGIVMDTYRRRHSLKPFLRETQCRSALMGSNNTLVWKGIKQRYDVARHRHKFLTGHVIVERTVKALQRRIK